MTCGTILDLTTHSTYEATVHADTLPGLNAIVYLQNTGTAYDDGVYIVNDVDIASGTFRVNVFPQIAMQASGGGGTWCAVETSALACGDACGDACERTLRDHDARAARREDHPGIIRAT